VPILASAPTPLEFADAWTEQARRVLEPIARRGRVADTKAANVAVYGDNVVNYLEAHDQRSVSLNKFLVSGHRHALREAESVAGTSNRVSFVKARMMADDLQLDYLVLRGRAPGEGTSTTLRGTWLLDLDSATLGPSGDIWWEQQTADARFLTPAEGVRMRRLGGVDFDAITHADLTGLAYSRRRINGSVGSSNRLTDGTVIAIQTDEGRYAKMLIESYGYDMQVRIVTYDHDGTPLALTPSTIENPEPPPPVEPPPQPQPVAHPVAVLTGRSLPRGVQSELDAANNATVGGSTWVASRFTIDPTELQRIEADPRLADGLAGDMAYPQWIRGTSVGSAPTTIDQAPQAMGERIIGWEEEDQDRVRTSIRDIAARLLPQSFLRDPNVRLRSMAAGDEDNTYNVAGLVAWNLATGEARALFAHKIW
jgi:hypothetical protein